MSLVQSGNLDVGRQLSPAIDALSGTESVSRRIQIDHPDSARHDMFHPEESLGTRFSVRVADHPHGSIAVVRNVNSCADKTIAAYGAIQTVNQPQTSETRRTG